MKVSQSPDDLYLDEVAARTEAYSELLRLVSEIHGAGNKRIVDEGMAMLAVVRRSIKTPPSGEVVSVNKRQAPE